VINQVKQFCWFVRKEWTELYTRLLLWLPLTLGIFARRAFLPSILGGFGQNVTILPGLRIASPKRLFIGSNCYFNEGVFITAAGTVRIGDWVGIGPDAKIWSVNHKFSDPDVPFQLQGWDHKEVVIEDDVWIGANAFIMPGVHVGKGAIISANTVLLKSVPPYAVMAGNPGRVVGWRKKTETTAGSEHTGPELIRLN
jgi:acetyltransferase-like isoleucine patch superfamily enzyme